MRNGRKQGEGEKRSATQQLGRFDHAPIMPRRWPVRNCPVRRFPRLFLCAPFR